MVMKPEPVFSAVESLGAGRGRQILLSPAGRRLDQPLVRELASEPRLDPHLRSVRRAWTNASSRDSPAEEISVGDYVLSGGEVPALVLLEAVTRLVPGVIGKEVAFERAPSARTASWIIPTTHVRASSGAMAVPDVLLSGNHTKIDRWRRDTAMEKTRRNRPDLLGT